MDETAAPQAIDYVRRGLAALGAIPDERTLVIERFFDGLGGTQMVIHTPFGIRLNRGLGLAIRKRLCQSFDFEIQASAIDDAVLLALNSKHSFPLEDLLAMVPARRAREVLTQAMLDAPMFEVRFRHVASRALTVMRSSRGRRIPAWIQRLRSQELVAALFPQQQACFENKPPAIEIPDHFIVAETIRECLEESADVTRMTRLLADAESGAIRSVFVDSISPSVFAHRLLLAWDYSFLDGGERANRRSRTVTMNRGMAEDVFRSEDLSEMLATEAVDTVVAEVSGRAVGRKPRDADELYELIRAHGSLSHDEISDCIGRQCAHRSGGARRKRAHHARARQRRGARENNRSRRRGAVRRRLSGSVIRRTGCARSGSRQSSTPTRRARRSSAARSKPPDPRRPRFRGAAVVGRRRGRARTRRARIQRRDLPRPLHPLRHYPMVRSLQPRAHPSHHARARPRRNRTLRRSRVTPHSACAGCTRAALT